MSPLPHLRSLVILCLVLVLAAACDRPEEAQYSISAVDEKVVQDIARTEQQKPPVPPAPQQEGASGVEKKIIKDGTIRVKMTDLAAGKTRIDSLIGNLDGYYTSELLEEQYGEIHQRLVIRIPAAHFETLINSIGSGIGKVLHKEISARDVTEEFLDITTRLENKRSVLARYREILKRAATVEDILNVEEHIRVLEEEIESAVGRLNYLSDQVDYSTLSVTLIQEVPYKYEAPTEAPYIERIKDALASGWTGTKNFLLFLMRIWPALICIGLIIFLWRRRRS